MILWNGKPRFEVRADVRVDAAYSLCMFTFFHHQQDLATRMRNSEIAFNPIANTRERLGVSGFEAQMLFWITSAVLFVTLVANQTHIETVDAVKLAPRAELLIRLAGTGLAGLLGLYGLLCSPRVQRAMFSFPGIWVTGIASCYVIGTVCSPYKGQALAHLVTFGCIFLFAPTAFAILGTRRMIEISLVALMTSLLASWFLYLFMPKYGVQLEITDESGSGVLRMGGTSHPNTLAGISGFAIIIACYLYFEFRTRLAYVLPIIGICLATYVFTQTRVAAVGAVLAVLFAYKSFWVRRDIFPLSVMLAMSGVGLFLWMLLVGTGGIGAETFTRSGDAEEITSFTGRDEIWSYVVRKIGESPLVGYGPGVSKVYLEQEEMLLHPHNVVLSLGFVGGVFCAILGVFMFANQLWVSWSCHYKLAAMFTIYVFLNSLTETFIFDYIPGTSTILWMVAIYWPALDDGSFSNNEESLDNE